MIFDRWYLVHAASMRFPYAVSLIFQKLKKNRNIALHVATGCVKMKTSTDHLPEEIKVLPVPMIISAYYVPNIWKKTFQSSNLSQNVVISPSGFRYMKQTLQTYFFLIAPILW